MRFGLDALTGLVPGVGDIVGAGMSGFIILTAARLGAPPLVLIRMLANVGIDAIVGAHRGDELSGELGWIVLRAIDRERALSGAAQP